VDEFWIIGPLAAYRGWITYLLGNPVYVGLPRLYLGKVLLFDLGKTGSLLKDGRIA